MLPAALSAGETRAEPYTRISKEVLYDGYGPYLELVEALYLPPVNRGNPQKVRLVFNVWPDVPAGTNIRLTLEYMGMNYVTTQYKVEAEKRIGITFDWKPDISLVPGDYFLRTRIPLEDQTGSLKKTISGMTERFPPAREPWPFLFMTEELRITVGREFTDPAEKAEVRRIYQGFVKALQANIAEYRRKMEAVREGREMVSNQKLNVEELEEYVVSWRKRQGAVQKKISEFESEKPSLFLRTRGAYLRLRTLARMVSKRAWQLQKEVAKKYDETPVDPRVHQFYARHYPLPVTDGSIDRQCQNIMGMLGLEAPEEKGEDVPREEKPSHSPESETGARVEKTPD